jgi:hypothetical protein
MDFRIQNDCINLYSNPIPMNRIVLPPSVLSALVSYQTDTESATNYLYLLKEVYRPRKIVIPNLHELFFGKNNTASKKQSDDGVTNTDTDYFSSYE